MDAVVKSTLDDEKEQDQITVSQTTDDMQQCLGDSDDTIMMEVKGQQDMVTSGTTAEIKDQNVGDGTPEVKGQHDLASEKENNVVSSQEEGAANSDCNSGTTVPMANGHLLMMEHHRNGLNGSRKELANVLTQHPPSSEVIEMKDLTHVENGILFSTEKNYHLSSTSTPHSQPLVNGEREATSTLANPSKSHSEPILANRTQCSSTNSSGSGTIHKTSVLLVAENPTHQTEAVNSAHNDRMACSIKNGNTDSRLALGVDGLPCSLDPLQKRVRELELKHRREVEELRVSLKEAQLQVAEAVRLRQLEREEKERLEEEGGGGDGVREGEGLLCGEGSGHSLHLDDMVSYTNLTIRSC